MKFFQAPLLCLFLPFVFVACDEKNGEAEEAEAADVDTHEMVYTEYFGMMEESLGALGSIESKESADAFLAMTNEMAPKLLDSLSRAKALPEPSDEEKKAAQSALAEVMSRVAEMEKKNRQAAGVKELAPEAKVAIGSVRRDAMEGEFGINMKEVSRQMNVIYGLKNY